jgi:hypothetical protein
LEEAAKDIGLIINEDKTKFMAITENPTNLCFLDVDGYKFEKVTQFKYLGTSITYDNDLSVEINNRIINANRSYYGLKEQLKSHLLSTQTMTTRRKSYIYCTCFREDVPTCVQLIWSGRGEQAQDSQLAKGMYYVYVIL